MSKEDHIQKAIKVLSAHTKLLVASDFDGTLCYLTEHYADARLDPIAADALQKLSQLPNTLVTVISGRGLEDLRGKFLNLPKVHLAGSHGFEIDRERKPQFTQEMLKGYELATALIEDTVRTVPGSAIERKPYGVAFHYRSASQISEHSIELLIAQLSEIGNGVVRNGTKVIEFCAFSANKAEALQRMQSLFQPTMTIFIGDDQTDEDVFREMNSSDIGIKVGAGATFAKLRVATYRDAIDVISQIADHRMGIFSQYSKGELST